jgi:hypothetical protein
VPDPNHVLNPAQTRYPNPDHIQDLPILLIQYVLILLILDMLIQFVIITYGLAGLETWVDSIGDGWDQGVSCLSRIAM